MNTKKKKIVFPQMRFERGVRTPKTPTTVTSLAQFLTYLQLEKKLIKTFVHLILFDMLVYVLGWP